MKTLKKISIIFPFVFAIFVVWLVIHLTGFNEPTAPPSPAQTGNNYSFFVSGPEIPEKMDFAGEKVPLEFFDVRESLDRELIVNTYWHSSTILLLKRAYRFFPVIEPILKKNNIPDDFKYLAVIESGLTNAISPANAVGYWQFLERTGREYGLEIHDEVDERYHIEKSTRAACRYLQEAYRKFNNWTLAAASYNRGMGGINKNLDFQKINSYYDLYLNEETARYIYRILAIKLIFENPGDYGFKIRKKDLYAPYQFRELEIDTPINNLIDFAAQQNTNYKILKTLNPWLRKSYLNNKRNSTYTIKIPEKNSRINSHYQDE